MKFKNSLNSQYNTYVKRPAKYTRFSVIILIARNTLKHQCRYNNVLYSFGYEERSFEERRKMSDEFTRWLLLNS